MKGTLTLLATLLLTVGCQSHNKDDAVESELKRARAEASHQELVEMYKAMDAIRAQADERDRQDAIDRRVRERLWGPDSPAGRAAHEACVAEHAQNPNWGGWKEQCPDADAH
jgi:hypothetical protein